MINKEEILLKPHAHLCELQLVKRKTWEKYCPLNGNMNEDDDCEYCDHFIIINFLDKEMTQIESIIR
jgi:hypothetical protein